MTAPRADAHEAGIAALAEAWAGGESIDNKDEWWTTPRRLAEEAFAYLAAHPDLAHKVRAAIPAEPPEGDWLPNADIARRMAQDWLTEALVDVTEDPNTHQPTEHRDYWAWVAESVLMFEDLPRFARLLAEVPDTIPAEPEPTVPAAALHVAYRERNAIVAALIRVGGYDAQVTMAPDSEGWWIVYAETPQGQVSWHVAPDDLDLFRDLRIAFGTAPSPWDGHTTEEKYERVAALRAIPAEPLDVERLAAIEHDQWMTWARSVMSADDVTIGPERLARWQSYMVPYADLAESVKEHDRVWARAVADTILPGEPER